MKHLISVALLLLAAIPAAAQEKGQTGVTIGYPGSIGVIWHASEGIGVRPDFSFSRTESESGTSGLKTSSWGLGFGVSGLFYVGQVRDRVRTYFTPRFGYSRTNTDSEPTSVLLASGSHANTYQYSGSFGVQYAPARRFSVYGEAGVTYSTSESTFTTSTTLPGVSARGKTTNSTFGTRAGLGLVLYFN